MKKKVFSFMLASAMVLSLAACEGVPSMGSGNSSAGNTGDSPSDSFQMPPKDIGGDIEEGSTATGELDEDTVQQLYNTYIDINNLMLGRLNDSLGKYFEYVDVESEEFKLLDESYQHYFCYSLSNSQLQSIEWAYETASSKGEKDALDQAFLALYPSLTSLAQALDDIGDYTADDTYLEDGFARSQEQHTALLSVLEEYFATGGLFMDELNAVASERQAAQLERMKEEGYEVLYAMNMLINLAQSIESELYAQEVWDDNILDMDLTVIQPLYDEFSTYVDSILAYDDDEEALSAEGLNNSAYWMTFVMYAEDTRDSISMVIEKVKKGEPLDQYDTMITSMPGQCSLTSFADGISRIIDSYNSIISY